MGLETTLVALLRTLCPRVSAGLVWDAKEAPYITYTHVSGQPLRYHDGQPMNKRWCVIQVNVWAQSPAEALGLIRQIEDLLCSTTAFSAEPEGEIVSQSDPTLKLHGHSQDFEILAPR